MRLHCLGVGPGWPCAERNASAFLYQWGATTALCDCGEPVTRRLKALGAPLESIDHVLLTHLHFDHVGGLFFFLQGCWVERRRRPLTIHAPAHGIPALREMLRQGFTLDALLPFSLTWRAWTPGRPVALADDARVTAWPTSHLDGLRERYPDEMPRGSLAVALLLEAGGRRIVHSGDLGAPEDLAPLLTSPADLLVVELGHFPPGRLLDFLVAHPPRRLALVHLAVEWWPERRRIEEDFRRRLPRTEVSVPTDGAVLDL
jgi:ribonuclease BN (tRNA processing enzyme)